jgi:tetratricopeptide (TPR) repeat protein
MSGAIRTHYADAMAAVERGSFRRALPFLREARALCYRRMQDGPDPRAASLRHLVRIAYVEEEISELAAIEELLQRPLDRVEDRSALLQARAVLLHNMFLAVRSFSGRSPSQLIRRAMQAYEQAGAEPGRSQTHLQIGHAALLAERGDRRAARALFNRLSEADLQPDSLDLAVAYYYTALGDSARAISRLADASRRDGWARGGPTRDGVSARHQAYRMHDFDRLRDHPRFIDLVAAPEERSLGVIEPVRSQPPKAAGNP